MRLTVGFLVVTGFATGLWGVVRSSVRALDGAEADLIAGGQSCGGGCCANAKCIAEINNCRDWNNQSRMFCPPTGSGECRECDSTITSGGCNGGHTGFRCHYTTPVDCGFLLIGCCDNGDCTDLAESSIPCNDMNDCESEPGNCPFP